MEFSGNTITEFIQICAEERRQEEKGFIKGRLEAYQNVYLMGAIDEAYYHKMTLPLFEQLAEFENVGKVQ